MDQFRSLLILVDHYRSGYDSRIKYYVRQTANNRAPKPKISKVPQGLYLIRHRQDLTT